jgi:hypothetical protein
LNGGASPALALTEGDYTYTVANGQATITDFPASYEGTLSIASQLGGYPVTSIGETAFYKCGSLTRVTIPSGVTNIGYCAFMGCSSMTEIVFPASVSNISAYAYLSCRALVCALFQGNAPAVQPTSFADTTGTIYYFQGATDWGTTLAGRPTAMLTFTYTLNNGSATITGFTSTYPGPLPIPDTLDGYPVTGIGNAAFIGTLFNAVSFPDTLTNLGECAFGHCDSLTQVTVPNSITDLKWEVFYGCRALTNVTIGSSVTNIANAAFKNCWALERITLPSQVSSLGYEAFADCYALKSVFFTGNAPLSDENSLFSNSGALTVYYLPGSTGWSSTFATRQTVCWAPSVLNDATFGFTKPGAFSFTIASTSAIPIVVQAATSPAAGAWTTLTNATLSGQDTLTFSDPASASRPTRFYRIAWP